MSLVVAAAKASPIPWYVARASGLVAWSLVTVSILWGLALSSRLIRRRGAPAWLLDLHRFLGSLTLVFTAVHLVSLYIDKFVPFTPRELFVPMATSYRPGPVAWGIVGLYLLVAVQVTSWLKRRIPRRLWHSVHLSSFGLFGVATLHGFTTGTDNTNLVVEWGAMTGAMFVFFLVLFRLLTPRQARLAEARSRTVAAARAA